MNKFIGIGRLTKDIELRRTQGQTSVANFTLAVNRNFKNSAGEIEADFINCVVWDKLAENLSVYTSKGSMIGIVGRIQTRNYEDNNGNRVYVTEVVAESIQFLETKPNNQQAQPANNTNVNNKQDMHDDANDFFDNFANNNEITDDDLPF